MESLLTQQPLLTLEEVARQLKTSERTVRDWIRNGELTGIKVGREWRVALADLDEYIQERRQPRKHKQ